MIVSSMAQPATKPPHRKMKKHCVKPRADTLPVCSSSPSARMGGGGPKTIMRISHAKMQHRIMRGPVISIQSPKSTSIPYSDSADIATRLVVPEMGVSAPPSVQEIATPSSSDFPELSPSSVARAMGSIAASASSVMKVKALTNMQPIIRTSRNSFGVVPNFLEMMLMKRTSSWQCMNMTLTVNEPMTIAVMVFIIEPKQPLAVSWMVFPGRTLSAVASTGSSRPTQ
mmetsp:Transcript_15195/g.40311  ORF Transcript_15195/g.40311 Transcript_15195/m.40311 type:complete len:227 (+) Transcript_15195:1752-2432(+)